MEHENNYVKEELTMQGIMHACMGRVIGSSFHECVLRVRFCWTVYSKHLCSLYACMCRLSNMQFNLWYCTYVRSTWVMASYKSVARPLYSVHADVCLVKANRAMYIPISWEEYGSALSIGTPW